CRASPNRSCSKSALGEGESAKENLLVRPSTHYSERPVRLTARALPSLDRLKQADKDGVVRPDTVALQPDSSGGNGENPRRHPSSRLYLKPAAGGFRTEIPVKFPGQSP